MVDTSHSDKPYARHRREMQGYKGLSASSSLTLYKQRRFSKVPTQVPTPIRPTLPQAIAQAFEEFGSFWSPKPDMAKAVQFAEEICKVLKDVPEEVAIAKASGLVAELSRVLNVSTFETRLSQAELTIKTYM
ncbi:uncharacterized protein LOC110433806 isoform X2 [Sorghum bicolor]|nr:uncharacterized protein LOC110433806 isoform X2 [Sorghum bicolor]XP_021312146.1 uncharacterized protein LOC110433806 isoform X2 [Sorghum bicolor]XP_021312147.1 uncharacterized protein LOC110433806 isoform X2 [Sorghum bicolor]XP_021312148.1 uncharacterized protein LOC110433806 isoform X2 [Sorghum bicolor]KXG31632.1 hypothetical protein SORBI_3003G032600 [Sorghum bicolor]KXG31633.2 hypothetical protein SORBI_3003G032600 [Sorghum bicolor]|eukprot:XP_021312145.1 uncharacterized protein LOC110433806 isoform X2 [Sorghum bicolor]